MRERVSTASLFALGVNGIVGVGIFFTPNLVAGLVPGPAGSLVFCLTATLLLPVAVTFSVLGRSLPLDGGPYVWARAAFGDGVAFVVGWIAAVSALLSTAAVFAGLRDHLAPVLGFQIGSLRVVFVGGAALLLSAVAALGLRPSAFTWDVLALLKLTPLALLLVLAGAAAPSAVEIPVGVGSFSSWQRAALLALFSLQGFEAVPVLAGSVRPARSGLLLATVGSLVFAAALYVVIHLSCVRALPDLPAHEAPLADAARALGGGSAGNLVSSGTLLSACGTAFGMIVVTPRYVAALGTEAGLGRWLGREDARGVPRFSLALTAVLVAVLSSVKALGSLFALSSAAVLVQYAIAIASLLRLSAQGRAPRWSAVPACCGLLTLALLAQAVALSELWILGGALGFGGVLAVARARARAVP